MAYSIQLGRHLADLQVHWDRLRHLSEPHHWSWRRILEFAGSEHWLLASALGALAVGFRKLRRRAQEGRAAGWPVTDATILTAQVKPGDGHWVLVEYRYYVRDAYRYGKFSRHFRRETPAQAFAAAVQHLHVPVHYSANNPDRSVLIERDLQFSGEAAGSLNPR